MLRTATQIRLFFTCWIVFSLHFATDFVREHFLVHAIVDSHSFDLGPYYGIHPDIFRNPPEAPHQGTHHGANPGVSMVAALPYFLLKPAVDVVVERELAGRDPATEATVTSSDTRARRVMFFKRTREMGVDVRFGLIGLITMVLCMGPLSAWSALVVGRLLQRVGVSERGSVWLALAYAFCTPMLFRTAFLNQNLAIAIFSVVAFSLLWDPNGPQRSARAERWRYAGAGALGGLALLSDYSGALSLGLLGLYGLWRALDRGSYGRAFELGVWYAAGAIPGIALLWWYQWVSFGDWLHPPQHWMHTVQWIEVGYKGVGGPQADLFWLLLTEPRYGVFAHAPLLALALLWPVYRWRRSTLIPGREALFCAVLALAYTVFFSSVQYTRLQWVTGIRYLMPVVPFLFLLTADVLRVVPRWIAAGGLLAGFGVSFALTMTRSQAGAWNAVRSLLSDGAQLPVVSTLSRFSVRYLPVSGVQLTLTLYAVAALLVLAVWTVGRGKRRAAGSGSDAVPA